MLAMDLGNTTVTWGRFDGESLIAEGRFPIDGDWPLPLPAWEGISSVAVASVQRAAEARLDESWTWPGAPELHVLGRNEPIPVETDVIDRKEVGADRLVNCLAWRHRSSRPAVIVDIGTAITFDLVSAEGSYRGGLILPGPALISRALHSWTSLLPYVEIEPGSAVFGRDTVSCIQQGSFGLLQGGVNHHLKRLRGHLSPDTAFVATGGGAATFAPWFEGIDMVVPHLTLEGIRLAHEIVLGR